MDFLLQTSLKVERPIVFNPSDPLKSKINGQLSGGGMSFSLSGTLERLQLRR
ncbi:MULTISPECIES: hypothetical protein [Pampinifervens]|uniref:hypothetical protein n=1 Tax=Pampinifervens TaxID=3453421 RepID=UPI0013B48A81|nr:MULTISPECIES: hypothetical protein [unclassified Hydrogenobacter]QID33594.1 hypothetical protein G3M65_07340 [Hydrogenobacter sp. T-8]WPM31737.1 hypothetical protein IAE16_07895 [Hydrogenobacter sp. T-2]